MASAPAASRAPAVVSAAKKVRRRRKPHTAHTRYIIWDRCGQAQLSSLVARLHGATSLTGRGWGGLPALGVQVRPLYRTPQAVLAGHPTPAVFPGQVGPTLRTPPTSSRP